MEGEYQVVLHGHNVLFDDHVSSRGNMINECMNGNFVILVIKGFKQEGDNQV